MLRIWKLGISSDGFQYQAFNKWSFVLYFNGLLIIVQKTGRCIGLIPSRSYHSQPINIPLTKPAVPLALLWSILTQFNLVMIYISALTEYLIVSSSNMALIHCYSAQLVGNWAMHQSLRFIDTHIILCIYETTDVLGLLSLAAGAGWLLDKWYALSSFETNPYDLVSK